NML
ncbi:hypothetical protein D018_4813B, partial [Vibrio parahaemolyticus VP2007-007]